MLRFQHFQLKIAHSDKWVNFGAPHGCLVGKYKAFGEKISALAWEKKPLNPSAQDLKIQWETQFSIFLVVDQSAPKKVLK